MPPRKRLAIAIVIGLVYGSTSFWYHSAFDRGAGDIGWALCAIRAIIVGDAPYSACLAFGGETMPANPLTTALAVMPLAVIPSEIAVGLFVGGSAGVLAWGLLGSGQVWRLLIFLSFPALACLQAANWSLMLLAALYVPGLAIVSIAKPHVGLPVFIARAWRNPLAYGIPAGLICLYSLLIRPTWPGEFLGAIGGYTGSLAIWHVPIVLLALVRWRQGSAIWLLMYAVVPLRPFYDWLMLAPVFATKRWLMIWIIAGWIGYGLYFFQVPGVVWLIWIPALTAVLLDREKLTWNAWLAQVPTAKAPHFPNPLPSSMQREEQADRQST